MFAAQGYADAGDAVEYAVELPGAALYVAAWIAAA